MRGVGKASASIVGIDEFVDLIKFSVKITCLVVAPQLSIWQLPNVVAE